MQHLLCVGFSAEWVRRRVASSATVHCCRINEPKAGSRALKGEFL